MFLFSLMMLLCTGVAAEFQCTLIPGTLKQIDAGDGQVYGVSEKQEVFKWTNNSWTEIPGKLIHVSVGPSGVWGVSEDHVVYRFQDDEWMSVTGQLKQVDAGGNTFLAGVNVKDNIFCLRRSCVIVNSSVVSFSSLDGELKYYSCGPQGCWGVSKLNDVYYRHDVKPEACQGSKWEHVGGKLIMVEVGTDGSVFGVSPDGDVFKRESISTGNPTGTSWTQLDFCSTFKHVSYDNGNIWLLNRSGEIYRCKNSVNHLQSNRRDYYGGYGR